MSLPSGWPDEPGVGNHSPRRVQYAALPYRVRRDGEVQIRLITSRETRRWVVPKGWPIKGLTPPKTAARESYEEAGLLGTVAREPIGMYTYEKRIGSRSVLCDVLVFPLKVKRMLQKWPERFQRVGFWFSIDSAAAAVQEPELSALIRALGDLMARKREAKLRTAQEKTQQEKAASGKAAKARPAQDAAGTAPAALLPDTDAPADVRPQEAPAAPAADAVVRGARRGHPAAPEPAPVIAEAADRKPVAGKKAAAGQKASAPAKQPAGKKARTLATPVEVVETSAVLAEAASPESASAKASSAKGASAKASSAKVKRKPAAVPDDPAGEG
ncbi:NUDIX domain-containing protein [Xanthobacter sp. AM11]|uniref:NUDIX hydrolase n=1 Tax=Xanthobacter sp. AM11 TaxID=3380643 RepID=UPI0039BFF4C6